MRRAFERLLRAAGFTVRTFASGIDLLDSISTNPPSCIILDLNMPFVDGIEVMQRMQKAEIRVPVVVITGQDSTEMRQRVSNCNFSAYLRKPVDSQKLVQAIGDAIANDAASHEGVTDRELPKPKDDTG